MRAKQRTNDGGKGKEQALVMLHLEMDLFALRLTEFAQAGRKVLLARTDERGPRWAYNRILRALRDLVSAGGKPFEVGRFTAFFQEIVKIANSPAQEIPANLRPLISDAEKNERAKYLDPREHAEEFVRTAVRICGGEWRPDGTVNLVALSKGPGKRPNA